MAVIYKKNAQNVYKLPLYAQFWTWWASNFSTSTLIYDGLLSHTVTLGTEIKGVSCSRLTDIVANKLLVSLC